MSIIIYLAGILLALSAGLFSSDAKAEDSFGWEVVGPGMCNQAWLITVGPDDRVWLTTDNGGIAVSADAGQSWQWKNAGLENHNVFSPVVIDPKEPRRMYLGTSGGFYKSEDGGENWKAVWNGLGQPSASSHAGWMGAVTLAPDDGKIVYLGRGTRGGQGGGQAPKVSGEIFRSTDYGDSFQVIGSIGAGNQVRTIAVSPLNPRLLLVASDHGLFRSEDGGTTWVTVVRDKPFFNVIFAGKESTILYASGGEDGVWKSTDSGATWTLKSNGLSKWKGKTRFPDSYTWVSASPHDPNYVFTGNQKYGPGAGAYKSTDGGENWTLATRFVSSEKNRKVTPSLSKSEWELLCEAPDINMDYGWQPPSSKVNGLTVDPKVTGRIWICTSRELYRSDDDGTTWQQCMASKVSDNPQTWTHRGIIHLGNSRCSAFDPKNGILYLISTDNGCMVSRDDGKSWRRLDVPDLKTARRDETIRIYVDPVNPSRLYLIAGHSASGLASRLFLSDDFGKAWREPAKGIPSTKGIDQALAHLAINPHDPSQLVLAGKAGVFFSADRGETWEKGSGFPGDETVNQLRFGPENSAQVWLCSATGLYYSRDLGKSWELAKSPASNIQDITFLPDGSILLSAGREGGRFNKMGIWRSTPNASGQWEHVLKTKCEIAEFAVVSVAPYPIYAVTMDHNYHDESIGDGVYRSIDSGKTWQDVSAGLPTRRFWTVAVAPDEPHRIYVGACAQGYWRVVDPVCRK